MNFRRLEICVYAVVALLSVAVMASFVNDMKTEFLAGPNWFLAHLSLIAICLFLGGWILTPARREAGQESKFGGLTCLGWGILAFVFACKIFVI